MERELTWGAQKNPVILAPVLGHPELGLRPLKSPSSSIHTDTSGSVLMKRVDPEWKLTDRE